MLVVSIIYDEEGVVIIHDEEGVVISTTRKASLKSTTRTTDVDLVSEHHAEVGLGQDEVDRVGQGAGPHGDMVAWRALRYRVQQEAKGASGCTASVLRS